MGTILILLNTTKSQPNTQTSLMPPPQSSAICKKLPPAGTNSVSFEITFPKKKKYGRYSKYISSL